MYELSSDKSKTIGNTDTQGDPNLIGKPVLNGTKHLSPQSHNYHSHALR